MLLTAPRLNASRVVAWEYKTGWEEGAVVSYAFGRPANTSRPYENRTRFNETDFSLRIALRRGDGRLYRFRSESEATGWFQLRVVGERGESEPAAAGLESLPGDGASGLDADSPPPSVPEPLSEPEIVGNSSVKAGGSTKLVCNVLEGKADSYRWKKNGELLLGSDHIRFVDNSTLCIVKATMNDSGYYACEVRNEVSQNETSFLLHVQSKWGFRDFLLMPCERNGGNAPQKTRVPAPSVTARVRGRVWVGGSAGSGCRGRASSPSQTRRTWCCRWPWRASSSARWRVSAGAGSSPRLLGGGCWVLKGTGWEGPGWPVWHGPAGTWVSHPGILRPGAGALSLPSFRAGHPHPRRCFLSSVAFPRLPAPRCGSEGRRENPS